MAASTNIKKVVLLQKTYKITGTLTISSYCSLEGITSDGNNYYSNTVIKQYGNVDAITLTNGSADQITEIVLQNFNITKEGTKTANGISLTSTLEKYGYNHSTMRGVFITNFDKGIYLQGKGFVAIGYNVFDTIECRHNNIGLMFDSIGDSNVTTNWANVNSFYNCVFNFNEAVGIYFNNLSMSHNILFSRCLIEANGQDYTPEVYAQYGSSGIRMHILHAQSMIVFDNCYIETNYPRRTGTPTADEYQVGNLTFPKDIVTNSATFDLATCGITVTNCFIHDFVQVGKFTQKGSWKFHDNQWGNRASTFVDDTHQIDYLFYIDLDAQWATQYTIFKFHERLLPDPNQVKSKYLYKFSEQSYNSNTSVGTITIDCDSNYGKYVYQNGAYSVTDLYVDGVNGNSKAYGLGENDAFSGFGQIVSLLYQRKIKYGDILTIHVVDNTTYTAGNALYRLDGNIQIVGTKANKTTKLIVGDTNGMSVQGNVRFNNLDIQPKDATIVSLFDFYTPNSMIWSDWCNLRFLNGNQFVCSNTHKANGNSFFANSTTFFGPASTTVYMTPNSQTPVIFTTFSNTMNPSTFSVQNNYFIYQDGKELLVGQISLKNNKLPYLRSLLKSSLLHKFPDFPTASLPTADLEVGVTMYDSTRKCLVLWNGSAWVKTDGSALA